MNQQTIDIVLLTYNRLECLKRTLKGIYERTKSSYRLIVIDNFSKDGTQEYLRKETLEGRISVLILNDSNVGQTAAFNKAFLQVESEIFVVTQDDLIVPDLEPCWLEQMTGLLKSKNSAGAVCMRIQRMPNVRFVPEDQLTLTRSCCPAYFRVQYSTDIRKLRGGFGNRKYHEASAMVGLMHSLEKKTYFATNIYADHISYMIPNKGYKKMTDYYGYNAERNKVPEYKPYPEIDPKTNKPIRL